MSYILDALRKADAQRERDPARGIHAQAVPAVGASAERRLARTRPFWIGGGLVVALLLAAGWYVSRSDPVQRALVVVANPPASAPATGTKLPAVAAQAPVPVQPAPNADGGPGQHAVRGLLRTQQAQNDPAMGAPRTARGAAAAGGATGAVPAPAPAPMPPAPSVAPPVPPTEPAPSVAPATLAAPATSAAPAPSVAPAPSAVAAPALAGVPPPQATPGLPPDAPKVAISGGVYSASPAQRLLIVNGQVFNEGSEVAPGVTVEEIKARTVVLKFRGARYTMAY